LPDELFENLPNLQRFWATSNNLSGILDLTSMSTKLVELQLGENAIANIVGLSRLTKLQILQLWNNRLKDGVEGLDELEQLTNLNVRNATVA
jgi:Leucine-rich repeat (LRR) protein